MMTASAWLEEPRRDVALIILVAAAFVLDLIDPRIGIVLVAVSVAAVLPTLWGALADARKRKVGIDAFNALAIVISFATGEFRSAAFIALMLCSARLLDWHTETRAKDAIAELLKLKPNTALIERGGRIAEIPADQVRKGDILVVESGARAPVDGEVVFGSAQVNESSVTGESMPVEKVIGDRLLSATLVESGALKIRATQVGKDSTIERMAGLMREAGKHKSRSQKMADRFAGIFLPIVAVIGAATYLLTRNLQMTAALFLIACADDMAVAIPLAMTASLGAAAGRGVIVKGGEWLDALGKMRILVLDKTGTLTYGSQSVCRISLADGVEAKSFWRLVSSAEKFSEHPVGRAVYREGIKIAGAAPDPEKFTVYKGSGVTARLDGHDVAVGSELLLAELGLTLPEGARRAFETEKTTQCRTAFLVFIDGAYAGLVSASDMPRPEAAESIARLKRLGVGRIVMFTGDNEETAADVARTLGIAEHRAAMTPEAKMREMEKLFGDGVVGMVGDGINDAPALARADVGIAMGGGGTAVAVEAADIVILTDDLSRLPEMVELGRRTASVIRIDMAVWLLTNVVGFTLVLTGLVGPALAAFYNFATDFLPLLNSGRLFRKGKI